ncbi:MAG TPA: antibiotic biosynthesis monooxygenase [Actinomycetota bacterium]|jgi:quinol monooxygenase YgiN|nr:antibiotic biosynthesis monooxygenase [Actinomycetota bacterium]
MIVRIFDTAIHPDDVERGKEIFREQVRPAFETFPGCHGIEMAIGVEEHSGELVEVVAISRWESTEAIRDAIATPDYAAALEDLKRLFRQAPIVRHFEEAD